MTLTREEDAAIRASLLTTIASLASKHGGLIPSDELQKPISIPGGGEIRLWDQSGIVTRKGLRGPIALFSRRDAAGKSRYPDQWLPDGDLIYRYRSGGPNVADNVALRNAFLEQLPMIHFEQQREGGKVFYWASWPIFVSQDYPENDYVKISAALTSEIRQGEVHAIAEPQRAYSERTTMYREHQKGFRASVLRAYATRCAICRLELPTLIEAAHIIPDKEEKGEPIVPNGIALCKIHHAAFDSNILGISPTARGHAPVITIKDSIMSISDGPMLLHGIQEMNNVAMTLPELSVDHPDNERLEIRYERFKAAS